MSYSQDIDFRDDRRYVELQAELEKEFEALVPHYILDGLDWDKAVDQVAKRLKRLIQSAAGPVFDKEGYISPIQTCTDAEVTRWFGLYAHREKLLKRVNDWISLARAVNAKRLLLDGSFVTAKDKPGDVDAVVLLPKDFRNQLRTRNVEALKLEKMFLNRDPKELFAAEDEEDWWGWFEFFSRTRKASGRRKGLIEVML